MLTNAKQIVSDISLRKIFSVINFETNNRFFAVNEHQGQWVNKRSEKIQN
jgi:hypothetical protein